MIGGGSNTSAFIILTMRHSITYTCLHWSCIRATSHKSFLDTYYGPHTQNSELLPLLDKSHGKGKVTHLLVIRTWSSYTQSWIWKWSNQSFHPSLLHNTQQWHQFIFINTISTCGKHCNKSLVVRKRVLDGIVLPCNDLNLYLTSEIKYGPSLWQI